MSAIETHVPIIGIDYDEPDTATYRGTYIKIKDAKMSLHGCCPTHDYEAMLNLAEILATFAGHGIIMGSSSVTHFAMDGN